MRVAFFTTRDGALPIRGLNAALAAARDRFVGPHGSTVRLLRGRLHRLRNADTADEWWEPVYQGIWVSRYRYDAPDNDYMVIVQDQGSHMANPDPNAVDVHHLGRLERYLRETAQLERKAFGQRALSPSRRRRRRP